MATMRTLPQALEELKAKDKNCPVTIYALRAWAKSGKVACVKSGKNFYMNMEALEAFLNGENS